MTTFETGQAVTTLGRDYLLIDRISPTHVVGVRFSNPAEVIHLAEASLSLLADGTYHANTRQSALIVALNAARQRETEQRSRADDAEQRIESINDNLIAEAISRDWCSDFEVFAEANGLRGCKREFEVVYEVKIRLMQTVEARDTMHAREQFDSIEPDFIREAVRRNDLVDYDVEIYDVEPA